MVLAPRADGEALVRHGARDADELLGDPRYLGAQPAFISALHTWGRSLSLHPHVHVLAADGGLDEHGVWVKPRRSHFLPARVLMLLFRGKLLAMLRQGIERRALRLPPDLTRARCASLLNRLGRKKWNVHIRARYAHGQGVAAYLARYLKGGPLKNSQLLPAAGEHVRFRYRPHRDAGESVVLNLTSEAFLARYLAHLPQPGAQTVRGYGLYGQPPVIEPAPLAVEAFLARFDRTPAAATCALCGARLRFVPLLAHGPAPPNAPH